MPHRELRVVSQPPSILLPVQSGSSPHSVDTIMHLRVGQEHHLQLKTALKADEELPEGSRKQDGSSESRTC